MRKIATKQYIYSFCRIQAETLSEIEMCDDFAGSITLETALVLPIFMMIVISLLSTIEVVNEYLQINEALYQVGKEVAFYSYPYEELKDIGKLNYLDDYEEIESLALAETFVRTRLIAILGADWIERSMVKGGIVGFHLYRSDICNGNNDIDLVLTYKMKPWFSTMGVGEFYLVNRCRLKAWTGYKPQAKEESEICEEYVYVAENGEVYHLYADCTHLCLSIQAVGISQIDDLRNEGGARYTSCEYCFDRGGEKEGPIYITDWGDRYHSDITCSGLKRTVREVKRSEVSGLGLCTRCSLRQE